MFKDQIGVILKAAVDKGIDLEINTSGLRNACRETLPGLEVMKLYKELGGEIVTVGSDAHVTEDLAAGISEAIALAKEAGFKAITIFERRKRAHIRI